MLLTRSATSWFCCSCCLTDWQDSCDFSVSVCESDFRSSDKCSDSSSLLDVEHVESLSILYRTKLSFKSLRRPCTGIFWKTSVGKDLSFMQEFQCIFQVVLDSFDCVRTITWYLDLKVRQQRVVSH
jgi:hypothetical protein